MPESVPGPKVEKNEARAEVMAHAVHDEDPFKDLELQARRADERAHAATDNLAGTIANSFRRQEAMLRGSRLAVLESHANGELMGANNPVERAAHNAADADDKAKIARRTADRVMDQAGSNYDDGMLDEPIDVGKIRTDASHEVAVERLQARMADLERKVAAGDGVKLIRNPVRWLRHLADREELSHVRGLLERKVAEREKIKPEEAGLG